MILKTTNSNNIVKTSELWSENYDNLMHLRLLDTYFKEKAPAFISHVRKGTMYCVTYIDGQGHNIILI